MGIAIRYPFLVSTLVWERRPRTWSLIVCLKATYALQHGQEAALSPEQDGIHDDIYWDHNPQASLYSPSDFVPCKPRTDVLLVGHACAPGGVPVESFVVRLGVGSFSKALRVTGDRVWVQTPEGLRPSAPRPLAYLTLQHERAARRGENLGGVPAFPAEPGQPLPNIDVVDEQANATPAFAPIHPRWRAVRDQLSPEGVQWSMRLHEGASGPAPEGLSFDFFNVAPRDQQLDRIPVGAPIVLENLLRQVPRLETRLPAVVPKVFYVDPASGRHVDVAMRCDTLWIDVDRAAAVVSWRGLVPVGSPAEQALGKVLVAAHAPAEQPTYDDVARLFAEPAPGPPAPSPVAFKRMPSASPPPPEEPLETTAPLAPSPLRAPMPFRKSTVQATMAMPAYSGPVATPFPLAEPGSAPRAPSEPIPGAPWSPSAPVAPVPAPELDETVMGRSPLAPELESVPPPAPPEAPRPASIPAPPAGSPWRVEAPLAESAPPPVAPPPPAPAVKSGLYEGFTSKKR